jgi:hypothetical protein
MRAPQKRRKLIVKRPPRKTIILAVGALLAADITTPPAPDPRSTPARPPARERAGARGSRSHGAAILPATDPGDATNPPSPDLADKLVPDDPTTGTICRGG